MDTYCPYSNTWDDDEFLTSEHEDDFDEEHQGIKCDCGNCPDCCD